MHYMATNKSKDWWAKFATSLQTKSILDPDGNLVSKRRVFDKLYNPDSHDQVQLELIMSGSHWHYQTIPRDGYDEATAATQYYAEVFRMELRQRAVVVMRGKGKPYDIESVVAGLDYALENYDEIIKTIDRKAAQ